MFKNRQAGVILIAVTLVLGLLLLLSFYFLDFVITDSKISHSQNFSTQTYYSTEAGIQEAIWKIKNDPDWNSSFQTNPAWSATIERNNPFGNGTSYSVSINNTDLGEAEITTTGNSQQGQSISQRVVKTKIFQALNPNPLDNLVIFSDNNISFSGVNLNITNAGIFANHNIETSFFSTVNVAMDASAVHQISTSWNSNLNAADYHSVNYPPPPDPIEMPQIDFDSDDPDSYLNQADNIYTAKQFSNLMANNPNLTISGITYVTGNVTIPRGQVLNVSGVLVADGNINIGTELWPFWENGPFISVTSPDSNPAGILSKKNIVFGGLADYIGITGLVYAYNTITIEALDIDIDISGSIICRNFTLYNLWDLIELTSNNLKVNATLGNPTASPIINIEHWEEEY